MRRVLTRFTASAAASALLVLMAGAAATPASTLEPSALPPIDAATSL